ncbi:hypothetical protein ACQP3D_29385, partial [Escherichia coli]
FELTMQPGVLILLPLLPEYWDYNHEPIPIDAELGTEPRTSRMLECHSINEAVPTTLEPGYYQWHI